MAAVFGGAQSIFTCAFDEAFQIPTEFSAEIALRTQQIVAYRERYRSNTVDPLGGATMWSSLTDRMEEDDLKVMGEIDAYGGVVKAIEDGWLQMRLAERATGAASRKIDSLDTIIVGQNAFRRENQTDDVGEVFRLDPKGAARVLEKFEAMRDPSRQCGGPEELSTISRRQQRTTMRTLCRI